MMFKACQDYKKKCQKGYITWRKTEITLEINYKISIFQDTDFCGFHDFSEILISTCMWEKKYKRANFMFSKNLKSTKLSADKNK